MDEQTMEIYKEYFTSLTVWSFASAIKHDRLSNDNKTMLNKIKSLDTKQREDLYNASLHRCKDKEEIEFLKGIIFCAEGIRW